MNNKKYYAITDTGNNNVYVSVDNLDAKEKEPKAILYRKCSEPVNLNGFTSRLFEATAIKEITKRQFDEIKSTL